MGRVGGKHAALAELVKYGNNLKVYEVTNTTITLDIRKVGDHTGGLWMFSIPRLRSGHYRIPAYWKQFALQGVIEHRLSGDYHG